MIARRYAGQIAFSDCLVNQFAICSRSRFRNSDEWPQLVKKPRTRMARPPLAIFRNFRFYSLPETPPRLRRAALTCGNAYLPLFGYPPISPALTHALPQVRVTIPSAGLRIVPISHRRGNRNSRKGTKMDSMADLNLTQSRRGFIKAAGATVLAGAAAASLGGCSANC